MDEEKKDIKIKHGVLEATGSYNPLLDRNEEPKTDKEDHPVKEDKNSFKESNKSKEKILKSEKKLENELKSIKKRINWYNYISTWILIGLIIGVFIIILIRYIPLSNPKPVVKLHNDTVVAKVGNIKILASQVNKIYNSLTPQQRVFEPKQIILQRLIYSDLLIQKAKEEGFTVSDSEVNKAFNLFLKGAHLNQTELKDMLKNQSLTINDIKNNLKNQLLIGKLLNATIKNVTVNDSEVLNFYNKYKSQTNKSFNEVKSSIKRYLEQIKKQKEIGNYLITLYNNATKHNLIKIYFNYSQKPLFNLENSTSITGKEIKNIDANHSSNKSNIHNKSNNTNQIKQNMTIVNNSNSSNENITINAKQKIQQVNVKITNLTTIKKCANSYNIKTDLVYLYSLHDCNNCINETAFLKKLLNESDKTITYINVNSNKNMNFVINCISPIQIPELICLNNNKILVTNIFNSDTKNIINRFINNC